MAERGLERRVPLEHAPGRDLARGLTAALQPRADLPPPGPRDPLPHPPPGRGRARPENAWLLASLGLVETLLGETDAGLRRANSAKRRAESAHHPRYPGRRAPAARRSRGGSAAPGAVSRAQPSPGRRQPEPGLGPRGPRAPGGGGGGLGSAPGPSNERTRVEDDASVERVAAEIHTARDAAAGRLAWTRHVQRLRRIAEPNRRQQFDLHRAELRLAQLDQAARPDGLGPRRRAGDRARVGHRKLSYVVIARLPEGQSVIRPGSACPHCRAPIAWYDNVPVLSFAVLGARCRSCRAPIAVALPAHRGRDGRAVPARVSSARVGARAGSRSRVAERPRGHHGDRSRSADHPPMRSVCRGSRSDSRRA